MQIGHRAGTLGSLLVHRAFEQDRRIAADGLGMVHRDVRIAHDVFGSPIRAEAGDDADARRHDDRFLIDGQRRANRVLHFFRDDRDGGFVRGTLEQHPELVTVESGDERAPVERVQPARDHLQEPIAAVMAERIVDPFESVQIDEQDRAFEPVGARLRDERIEPLEERDAVR